MSHKVEEQAEEFFVTGIEKYLDAVSAVRMFEEEVQRRVKPVVAKHQSALAELFGADWNLRSYHESGTGSPPAYVCLGQQVVFKGFGKLYFYYFFGRDKAESPYLQPRVCFWRERVSLLKELWTTVEAIQTPKSEVDSQSIYVKGDVLSNDWASCEKGLNAVICDWIKLWQRLGGLPKYLTREAR